MNSKGNRISNDKNNSKGNDNVYSNDNGNPNCNDKNNSKSNCNVKGIGIGN